MSKRILSLLILMALFMSAEKAQAATGKSKSGTLVGKLIVTAQPRPLPRSPNDDDDGLYQNANPVPTAVPLPEEVVIYLKRVPGSYTPPDKPVRLDQKFLNFTRRVLPVLAGTTVAFTNHDPVYHSVFTNSQLNPFKLGRKENGQTSYVKLSHSEVPIKVYCEIHSSMRSFILVLDNPFFTTVGPGQDFEISGIPPGTYTLAAWHDYWQPVEQKVKIKKGRTTRADVTLDKVQK